MLTNRNEALLTGAADYRKEINTKTSSVIFQTDIPVGKIKNK
jgi:hypothetical protein